ncbi:hypothetical protein E2C01_022914 [Portunus trituberculatus]|uniref:Uncharacterized protein n=1 Tax=Portunus trituberculatus TaxID=210409 RepID=A0A5B7E8D5_PORTR|nr:hypothetical protein [Portunus trituberculatus]
MLKLSSIGDFLLNKVAAEANLEVRMESQQSVLLAPRDSRWTRQVVIAATPARRGRHRGRQLGDTY